VVLAVKSLQLPSRTHFRPGKTSHRIACNCNKFAAIKLLNGAQIKRREKAKEFKGKNFFLPNQKRPTPNRNSHRWFSEMSTGYLKKNIFSAHFRKKLYFPFRHK